jgi:hypothetical protein
VSAFCHLVCLGRRSLGCVEGIGVEEGTMKGVTRGSGVEGPVRVEGVAGVDGGSVLAVALRGGGGP